MATTTRPRVTSLAPQFLVDDLALTPEEWGKLCWKHMSYHLRQFGV